MNDAVDCRLWNPGACEGTSECPARCPRYVAPDGRAYTILSVDDSLHGIDVADTPEGISAADTPEGISAADGPEGISAADGQGGVGDAALPAGNDPVVGGVEDGPVSTSSTGGGSGRGTLVAIAGSEVVGRVDYDGEVASVRLADCEGAVSIAGDGDDPAEGDRSATDRQLAETVGVELVRQLIARRVESEAERLEVHAPEEVLEGVADDLVVVEEQASSRDRRSTDAVGVVDLTSRAPARTARVPADRGDVAVSRDLDALFAPASVAVVGATDREGSIGRAVVSNLQASFEGHVVPVSQSSASVLGMETVSDVSQTDADLAVVVLPADAAVRAVEDAAGAGVEAIAVLSAGFGEGDDDGGARRAARVREAAAASDVALVGPNALGVLSTRRAMNASFSPALPEAGGVSMLSHSGAMVTATVDWAADAGVGMRDVVSLGNAAGIDEADVLRYWGADPGTDVVFAYLEDVQDGDAFVEAAREVSRTTPVVALKAGRSAAGMAAASSHTGALAGDDAGFQAAFDAAGVVRASSQQEAYDLLAAFSRQPLPMGERVAVVTNAGGPGVLAADAIATSDVRLAELSEETRRALRERLPAPASVDNPLDVLGDASVDRFVTALEAVLDDPGVDAALVVSTPHPLVDQTALVEGVADASRRFGKPVATCLSGGGLDAETRDALAVGAVPNYPDADRAAASLGALAGYAAWRRPGADRSERSHRPPADASVGREPGDRATGEDGVRARIEDAISDGVVNLGVDAMDVLDAGGIETPDSVLLEPPFPDDVASDSTETVPVPFDGPFALKVASPDLVHKSDVGGVRVGVDREALEDEVTELVASVRENAPDATVTGVLVQALAPDGVECVAGVTTHPRFGALVTFGLGGVLVEHLEDVAHALAPLSHGEARRLVSSLDGASILDGARGAEPVDRDALAGALVRLSHLAVSHDAIEELEVNPLIATPDRTVAVDFHAELSTSADDAGPDT